MTKYKPVSRRNLEDRVKDLSREAKDRGKHVVNVKKDAKALADVAKKIKPTGTIEAGKEIKKALKDSGELIRLNFWRWRAELSKLNLKSHLMDEEFRSRLKNSKSNCEKLTDALNNITETAAACKEMDQARRASKKDMDIIKVVSRTLRGIRQGIQDLSLRLGPETALEIVLNEGDGDWAEFSLDPDEIREIVEEHQMDIELRGPVLAKDRRNTNRIEKE